LRLELSEAALADIRSIREFTLEHWGTTQEEIYLNSMWSVFLEIQKKPSSFRFRNDLFPSCQIATCGSHLILFRIHNEAVQVARVLHRSMDFQRHIPEKYL
jgi:toxin ParE1/3/4